jgi:hypothetical protein
MAQSRDKEAGPIRSQTQIGTHKHQQGLSFLLDLFIIGSVRRGGFSPAKTGGKVKDDKF